MTFEVTILGNSSALPTADRHHSAHVLNVREQFYLADCGEGTQTRLMKAGVSPLRINAAFISHVHGDHTFGLPPLIATMGMLGRKTPFRVFGPESLAELMECFGRLYGVRFDFEVQFHAVDARQNALVWENKVMEVWSIPLRHRVPATGYLFREKEPGLNVRKEAVERYGLGVAQIVAAKNGLDVTLDDGRAIPNAELTYIPYRPRSYAYCSDTQYSGKVASIVEGVDLLYHEATFSDADKHLAKETGHSTTTQAAKTALKAGAGRLLIGHFSSRYKDLAVLEDEARSVFPETYIAREGQTFAIPLKKNG